MSKLKETLTKKILSISGVSEKFWPNDEGGFTSFIYKEKDFAHYHSSNEIDLRLTKKVIAKEELTHPTDSSVHPKRAAGFPWIELRFSTVKEVNETFRLVKLAIQQI